MMAYVRLAQRFWATGLSIMHIFRGYISILILLLSHLFVVVICACLMPEEFGRRAVAVLALGAGATTFIVAGGNLLILRALGLARPASAHLARLVQSAVDRTGIPVRGTYEVSWPTWNAMALPLPRYIIFADRMVRQMTDDQMTAIATHELAHLAEPRLVLAARLARWFVFLPLALAVPMTAAGLLLPYLGAYLVLFLGVRMLWIMGRRMEERADRLARGHEAEAGVYARALERLYQANLMPAVMASKRRVHPHLYDRLLAAGLEPVYSRPDPPSRWRAPAALGVSVGFAASAAFIVLVMASLIASSSFRG